MEPLKKYAETSDEVREKVRHLGTGASAKRRKRHVIAPKVNIKRGKRSVLSAELERRVLEKGKQRRLKNLERRDVVGSIEEAQNRQREMGARRRIEACSRKGERRANDQGGKAATGRLRRGSYQKLNGRKFRTQAWTLRGKDNRKHNHQKKKNTGAKVAPGVKTPSGRGRPSRNRGDQIRKCKNRGKVAKDETFSWLIG